MSTNNNLELKSYLGLTMMLFVVTSCFYNYFHNYRHLKLKTNTSDNFNLTKAKKILYYTTFYSAERYGYNWKTGMGWEPFKDCPVSNCYFTNDRDMFGGPVAEFDALMFMMRFSNLLDENHNYIMPDPKDRKRSQRYILYVYEPTIHSIRYMTAEGINGKFNWTINYKLDSDIPHPYGWLEPKDPSEEIKFEDIYRPKWIPFNKTEFKEQFVLNETTTRLWRRPKNVSWVVSHCNTQSRRMEYVQELMKYIDVEIQGQCANNNSKPCGRGRDSCLHEMGKEFKFYLAFEQVLCDDYVSEKFWNALSKRVIPIVMGGSDYSRFAPPNSYIDVKDFESPQDLAKYLRQLIEDPKEYLSYFWWTKYYKVMRGKDTNSNTWCELCRRLNDPDEPEKIFSDFESFKKCDEPKW